MYPLKTRHNLLVFVTDTLQANLGLKSLRWRSAFDSQHRPYQAHKPADARSFHRRAVSGLTRPHRAAVPSTLALQRLKRHLSLELKGVLLSFRH